MVNRTSAPSTAMNSNVLTRRQPVFPLVVVGRDFAPVGGPYGGGSVVMFSWDLEWVYMAIYIWSLYAIMGYIMGYISYYSSISVMDYSSLRVTHYLNGCTESFTDGRWGSWLPGFTPLTSKSPDR